MKYQEEVLETRVITKVPTVTQFEETKPDDEILRVAIIDTETTGLNYKKDSIIELGFQVVEYTKDGKMYDVIERYNELNQPKQLIGKEITSVTGISNEDLLGHKIDWDDVKQHLSNINLFIAHNAGFDRKFLEKYSDIFINKPWGCSQKDVEWLSNFGSSKDNQEYLLWKVCHSYYPAHRAIDDVTALTFLLSHQGKNNETVLKSILERAASSSFNIKARNGSFHEKDELKAMGCRWNAKDRVWEILATQSNYQEIIDNMKKASPSCTPEIDEINSLDRFSERENL